MTTGSSSKNPSGEGESDDWLGELAGEMMPVMVRAAWAILRDWQRADDAAQEAFWLFSRRLSEIPDSDCRGWLVQTAVLKAKELRRSDGRQRQLVERWVRESGLQASGFSQATRDFGSDAVGGIDDDTTTQLVQAIGQLPSEQQQVVQLRMSDGLTFAQIAERVDAPIGTVLSRMRLALKKLRAAMTNGGDN